MSLASQYNTELLAPAGSIQAFFAALEAGADAVYCGLHDFSARAKAKNFSLNEMEQLCAYAHKMGRKLYIPLNTLIKTQELPHLCDILEGIAQCRPDGLIIQDLGVYRLVQRFFPEIPLHASTQMAVHNRAGVQMLEQLGFERGVLARELTLQELAIIRHGTTLEIEHFIHGALCYSISGHCLFSSFQTGDSGNRGGCRQPCRRSYKQGDKDQFTFSTSDFATLAHIPQLAKHGVMSFKIEGRMKNAEYVWNVVKAYRTILDCPTGELPQAIRTAQRTIDQSGGRKTSSGFLTGKLNTILLPDQKGGIGTPVGTIGHVAGKAISFTSETALHIGDRIRVQPATDMKGYGFTLREMHRANRRLNQIKAGQAITVTPPFSHQFQPGDHIFKISTGRGFTLSEEACRRRLSTVKTTKALINLNISCTATQLTITATTPWPVTLTYDIETFPAQKSPLSRATLTHQFKKTAHPDLQLAALDTEELPPVIIKPSALKKIRRDFYNRLSEIKRQAQETATANRRIAVTAALAPTTTQKAEKRLYVQTDKAHDDLIARRDLHLILPLDTPPPKKTTFPCFYDIPAIIYPQNWQKIQGMVDAQMRGGQRRFRLNNLAHFDLFKQDIDVEIMAGPALYCLNPQAMLILQQLGAKQYCTSPEDDLNNITALSQACQNLIVQIYGTITLMSSRIPLAKKDTITTPADQFTPLIAGDLTHIQPAAPFSLTGHLHELPETGLSGLHIDLRNHSTTQRQLVLEAVAQNKNITGSTLFNFKRGLK